MKMSRREFLGIYLYAKPRNEQQRMFNQEMLNKAEAILPISHEALELCGEWGKGLVFKGLTRAMTHHPLKQWIADAGIKKKITFHCFRHSYAVIQISLGTDIYTVSKMLTHKNVTTTQIYADLVNSKKRETANKISLK